VGTVETHQTVSRIHYGMDTRIGYPNEHLAGDSDEEFLVHYMQQQYSNEWYREKQSAVKIDEIAAKSSCISPSLLPRPEEGRKK
jgi:cell division protein FtsA